MDALELDGARVVGHSLGAMFALWHMAAGAERISGLVAFGIPAVALPGTRVRMPLSLLTVPGLGRAVLRSPGPRPAYRRLLAGGLGSAGGGAAPGALLGGVPPFPPRPGDPKTDAPPLH